MGKTGRGRCLRVVVRRPEAYRAFQRKRRRLRETMRRIVEIVTEIREAHLEKFP